MFLDQTQYLFSVTILFMEPGLPHENILQISVRWNSKTRVMSCGSRAQIYELREQFHELQVQIYKLRVKIHQSQVQIHEFRIQKRQLGD